MPVPALNGIAAKSGKTIEQVETIWDQCKYDAKGKFNIRPGEKPPAGYWPYVMTLVKKRVGLSESFKDFSESYDEMDFDLEYDSTEDLSDQPDVLQLSLNSETEADYDVPLISDCEPPGIKVAPMQPDACPTELLNHLIWARDCAHKLHLSTPSYAQHIALEEFYNGLLELFDQLAEVVQGKYGIISSLQVQGSNCEVEACAFICNLACWLDSKAHNCICPDDTFIHNIVDEIQAITYRAKYKIENLK